MRFCFQRHEAFPSGNTKIRGGTFVYRLRIFVKYVGKIAGEKSDRLLVQQAASGKSRPCGQPGQLPAGNLVALLKFYKLVAINRSAYALNL